MPAIPFKESERSSMVGAPDRSYSDVKATPADFGGGIGDALNSFGSGIVNLAAGAAAYDKKEEETNRQLKVATAAAGTDLLTPSLQARTAAPQDGSGVVAATVEAQRQIINDRAEQLFPGDAKGAAAYRMQMLPQVAHIRNTNVEYEFQQKQTADKLAADDGLNTLYNNLRIDPTMFDLTVKQGNDVIDKSEAITAGDKAAAKDIFAQKAAATAVEGKLMAAKTIDDVKAVQAEMNGKDSTWRENMSAEDFKRLTVAADGLKKQKQTAVMSAAKTELSSLRTMSDDPTVPPIPQERLETLRRTIDSAGSETDVATVADLSRLLRDEQLKAATRGLPAYQIAALQNAAKGGVGQAYPNLPPEMADNINRVSKLFPGVDAGYLGATATLEYGGQFKKDGKTDYGVKSDTSSATGVYQFTQQTWRDTTNNPGVKAVLAANGFPNVNDDTRKDPLASTIAAAALASQNKSVLTSVLHRDVSNSELYMAHFFGADDAAKFLSNYVTNRDAPAASITPQAAASNKAIFYNPDGKPRTVAQVYDLFTTRFVSSPSQVAFGDSQTYKRIHDASVKAQSDNPVGYAASQGSHVVTPLDQPGAFQARGQTFRDIGTYYRIPDADNKPFDTATEVPQLKKAIQDGSPEQIAQLLGSIGSMDKTAPGAASAGLAQLGEKNTAYGVAAQLMQGAAPDMATAATIIRGQQRLNKDDSTKTALGEPEQATNEFNKTIGTSLSFIDPASRDAIRKAAEAHYIETATVKDGKFDKTLFNKSVNAVLGGNADKRVGTINSTATVLPQGVPEASFEKAVDNLAPPDLIAASVDRKGEPNGMAPVYSDGTLAKASDISAQGKLRYVGGDIYLVQMADNKMLVTHDIDPVSGSPQPYRMKFDKSKVVELAGRTTPDRYNGMQGVNDPTLGGFEPPAPIRRPTGVGHS